MMILPFSARLRGTLYPDADVAQRLRADPGMSLPEVAIVNPQQAQLAQVIHPGEQRLAGRPLVGGL